MMITTMARTVQPLLRAEVCGVTQLPAVAAEDSLASKLHQLHSFVPRKAGEFVMNSCTALKA